MSSSVSRFSIFQYDIPEQVRFPNPTGYLRARQRNGKIFAFKTQYSMWLVDADNPPYALMQRMEKAGCIVDLYALDPRENDKNLARAATQMRRDVEAQRNRMAKSLRESDAKLEQAETDYTQGRATYAELVAARRRHADHREQIVGRMETLVEQLEQAAQQFGIQAPDATFDAARKLVGGIRALGSARAETYSELAKKLEGTAIGAAAKEAEVPAEILMDYAEEHGVDVAAAREILTGPTGGTTTGATATATQPRTASTAGASNGAAAKQPSSVEVTLGKRVAYNAHFRTFSAEASDLGLTYAPAELRLKSPKTGKVVALKRTEIGRNGDNEVIYADYKGEGYTFRLFND